MASAVDICNLALGYLGDSTEITAIEPPDGSINAERCARFYPVARREMQEMHAWDFNTRRVALVEHATAPPASWDYRYVKPSGCIRTLAVLAEDSADGDETQDYISESLSDGTQCILTNVENATLRFLVEVTDTTKFSALFVDACAMLLASKLAGPVIKGKAGIEASLHWYKMAISTFGSAAKADATSEHSQTIKAYEPPWVSDR